jgi:alkanesulfonate monooxygenase SsuD/methylene tetrahydromethanopterin reductase-like flavin-dependent oxidoreductase (luciferase family)
MKLGAFLMPSHPPERSLGAAIDWDLAQLERLDQLGFSEAWIGEHFSAPWEPVPAPDLLIAQALPRTTQIKLCPGAHLLPYHHPIELAHRVAQLDHMARGRYMLGIGISGLPSDLHLYGLDPASGENRRMTLESLDIMLRLWRGEPFAFDGEFWKVRPPASAFDFLKLHLKPYQQPHPPIGIAGLSPGSETLKIAGERGFLPLSISLNPAHTVSHWRSVEEGAARSGRTPDRREWRLVREVYVAATDDEAKKRAREGALGRCWREYLLPFYVGSGMGPQFLADPAHGLEALDVDYLIEHAWFVGSPQTVVDKIGALQRATGGFGCLLIMLYDWSSEAAWWEESLQRLVEEVWPHFPD